MSMEGPLPSDDPRIQAWTAYQETAEYRNSFGWADHDVHRAGSLWAAYQQGWQDAEAAAEITALRASLDAMRQERDEAREANDALAAELAARPPRSTCGPDCHAESQDPSCILEGQFMEQAQELREEVKRLRRIVGDVAARMHRQVKAADGYAEEYARKDEVRPTAWQIGNSHFADFARELEAALSPRTAAMEHTAKERAEEIEEGRNG